MIAALVLGAALAQTSQYIHDGAGMFGAATVSQLDSRISNFHRDTGKEIVVVTVPSVSGNDDRTAAENTFAQQSVNGVLIFIDKGDRQTQVIPDRAAMQAGWWSGATSQSVVNTINSQFKTGNFDGGITAGVNAVFDVYRSHISSLHSSSPRTVYAPQQSQTGGVHISVFWWIIIALFAFFIIRSLIRARQGSYYGGGYGGPGYGPGGPGPGYGPGYGGGFGYGGGWGGGFWSGLLGGLGGAWLGNELFGHQNYGGMQGGMDPGSVQQPDAGGWQSDPGQADMGGSAGGGWGGGDFGGGFGGGDAGGGW